MYYNSHMHAKNNFCLTVLVMQEHVFCMLTRATDRNSNP